MSMTNSTEVDFLKIFYSYNMEDWSNWRNILQCPVSFYYSIICFIKQADRLNLMIDVFISIADSIRKCIILFKDSSDSCNKHKHVL